MMNAVGGTSLHYWAQHWRLNPWDFKVVSGTTRRYGASRIPKGSTVEDWPFGYEELEPYYDKLEHEIGVSGQAGNVNGKIDPRGNPFEGPRKREYPMPPLRWTAFHERMAACGSFARLASVSGARRDQLAAFRENRSPLHVSRLLQYRRMSHRCESSTAVTTIPRAQATGKLKVVTRATAMTIEVDNDGRATGVTYVIDGTEYFQPAKVVLLASYIYENVRLLLLSKSKAFPNGSVEQPWPGRQTLLQPPSGRAGVGVVSVRHQGLVRAACAGRRGRQLGRRQLRSRGPRLHRRRQSLGDVGSPADRGLSHEHVRLCAELGLAVEGIHQAERRSLSQLRTFRRRRCRTRKTFSTSIPR